ncbi:MAG: RHS repeat protein, partial [Chlamydiia bacterium]|nr:RHS repeat protein [Chlamydiia bacterium]
MRKFFLFVVLSVLLLTGCDINKSAKLAFPIEGLSYETASQSGVTDKEGAFVYAPQETEVTFSLGELALATLPITEVITLEQFFHLDSFPEGNEINGEVLHSEEMEGTTAFLTLLYVLDEDNNISNGVKINTEVAKLVKDLDLTQGYRKLLSDFDFLTLLATIEVNKALPRTAYIPNITLVLTEFYAALGLNSPYSVVLEDGTFEKKNYSYNTLGLLLEKTVLNIDANRTYRYRYTYNALGLQTLYEYDGDISTIESDTVRKYRYNAFGNRIEELYNDRNTTKIYDENLQVIESHRDDDNDGTIDSKYYIERDEQGNIVKTRSDSGNNGSIEREEQYVYDEEGREVSKTTTSNGSVEIRTYQYGSEGYLTKEVERKDGNLTSEITFNVQGQ